MEDLTLEEFMRNPEKYREPEPDGPYAIHYYNRTTNQQGQIAPSWLPEDAQDLLQHDVLAAIDVAYAVHNGDKWRSNDFQYNYDVVVVNADGHEVARITTEGHMPIGSNDLPF